MTLWSGPALKTQEKLWKKKRRMIHGSRDLYRFLRQSASSGLAKAVQENKPFIMNVYHCVDREQVEKYLKSLTDNLLMGVIDEESVDMKVREEDKKFIARVYSYSFIGLMLDWIKDDMKEAPEKIVHRFALVIQDSLKMALDRFKI